MKIGSMVQAVVCSLVSGNVESIGPKSIKVSGHKLVELSREWATNTALSELHKMKKGDRVVIVVVEHEDSLFAVELQSKESPSRIR